MGVGDIDTATTGRDDAKRILVAGVGNVFHGDDGFGVHVARALLEMEDDLPEAVQVTDFGIRSYDLAFAMLDGYESVVLVDAVSRNASPGTVFLLDADVDSLTGHAPLDGHSMNPNTIMSLVQMMGGFDGRLFVVGCEPAELTPRNGEMALTPAVRDAVGDAVDLVQRLIDRLLRTDDAGESLQETANPNPGGAMR